MQQGMQQGPSDWYAEYDNKELCVINRQFVFVKEGIIEHKVQTQISAKKYQYLDM
jgi:hypothetical protein